MAYRDLRDFIRALEEKGELKRIPFEVDPILEITEFADRAVKRGGGIGTRPCSCQLACPSVEHSPVQRNE